MSARTRPLRVIQWATGTVGRHAIAAILAHPELELVGARVYSPDKAGRDVGELCGLGRTGVVATASSEEVLALEADCVLYAAQGEMNPAAALDDICRLLASGKNVVSTAVTGLIYPKSLGAAVVARLEEACRAGQASFHGTGIEPGWAAEVAAAHDVRAVRVAIDSIRVQELLDYSSYPSAPMLVDIMGFGRAPDANGAGRRSAADGRDVPRADPARGRRPRRDDRGLRVHTRGRRHRPHLRRSRPARFARAPSLRSASASAASSRAAAPSRSSTSPGSAPIRRRTGRAVAAGASDRRRAVDAARGDHRGARRGRERPGLPRHRHARHPRDPARLRRAAGHPNVSRPAADHRPRRSRFPARRRASYRPRRRRGSIAASEAKRGGEAQGRNARGCARSRSRSPTSCAGSSCRASSPRAIRSATSPSWWSASACRGRRCARRSASSRRKA